jgi:hypothetical protein
MDRLIRFLKRVRDEEEGHIGVGLASLVAAFGALALACGAAEDISWVAYLGGVLLGLGIFAGGVARHRGIDYEVYSRLDKLEGR